MTDDYVLINGTDTRDIGVFCTSLPPIQIPSERVNKFAVPGRSGLLTIKDDSFDPVVKPVGFFYEGDDPVGVAAFLKSAQAIVFSNEPDKEYLCNCFGQSDLANTIFNWHEFTVDYECNPEKKESSPQSITATSGMTLTNVGNRKTRPTFEITGTGTIVLTVGTQIVTLTSVTGTTVVDGDLQECYLSTGSNRNLYMTGEFPIIEAGESLTISWTGTVTSVLIKPNWRFV